MLDSLFPIACAGCGCAGGAGRPVCERCAELLRPALVAPPPRGVDAWWAPFSYAGPARELVARLKYRNVRAVVPWLAAAMVAEWLGESGSGEPPGPGRGVELVTWAPTTPAHCRARGFDPAELLARAVARRAGARAAAVLRRRPGPPQTGLAAAARRGGPRFAARRRSPARILLVDDVATTGATLTAAAEALRDAGASEVSALTAARTPPPSSVRPAR